MLENRRPRHIRDIAHLYISHPRHSPQSSTATVWMIGEDKRCFPAVHVANLAAALSAANYPVRLLEQSGLLPNVGYFMSLSPRRYILWDENGDGLAAGLGAVEVDFSPKGSGNFAGEHRNPGIEIVHLPPLSPPGRLQDVLCGLDRCTKPGRVLVVLGTGRTPIAEVSGHFMERLRPTAICTLRIDGAGYHHSDGKAPDRPESGPACDRPDLEGNRSPEGCLTQAHSEADPTNGRDGTSGPEVIDIGTVADWEPALNDRVPAVLRTPGSVLSRSYRTAADGLLLRINDLGRKSDGTPAIGISTATGSDMRHR